MPTIEVVSVGATKVPQFPAFKTMALLCEAEPPLRSHRSLFSYPLKSLGSGCIVHLAGPDFDPQEGGFWFAGGLMGKNAFKRLGQLDHRMILAFKEEVMDELKLLFQILVEASPIKTVLFLTDMQSTEEETVTLEWICEQTIKSSSAPSQEYPYLDEFWRRYDNLGGVQLHKMFRIGEKARKIGTTVPSLKQLAGLALVNAERKKMMKNIKQKETNEKDKEEETCWVRKETLAFLPTELSEYLHNNCSHCPMCGEVFMLDNCVEVCQAEQTDYLEREREKRKRKGYRKWVIPPAAFRFVNKKTCSFPCAYNRRKEAK